MQNEKRLKIAVIFHNFGPYHIARLNAAAEFAEIHAIEITSREREYSWIRDTHMRRFKCATLFDGIETGKRRELRRRFARCLTETRPDAVAIPGWSEKGSLAALDWCVRAKVSAILMSESCEHDEARTWWKEAIKRRIVRLCTSALVGGQHHKNYLRALGMPGDRVFPGYDVVDNGYFAKAAASARQNAERQREELTLPRRYFLASARFVEKKNLHCLLQAYALYRAVWSNAACKLVILGDGPLRESLLAERDRLGLREYVLMPGFQQYDALPAYYGLAEAFVHASTTEQWGLVINEAIASGLPVIVSDRCGCVPELIKRGLNGLTFDPYDTTALRDALLAVSSGQLRRDVLQEANRRILEHFAPASFGRGLLDAAECAIRCRREKSLLNQVVLAALLRS